MCAVCADLRYVLWHTFCVMFFLSLQLPYIQLYSKNVCKNACYILNSITPCSNWSLKLIVYLIRFNVVQFEQLRNSLAYGPNGAPVWKVGESQSATFWLLSQLLCFPCLDIYLHYISALYIFDYFIIHFQIIKLSSRPYLINVLMLFLFCRD